MRTLALITALAAAFAVLFAPTAHAEAATWVVGIKGMDCAGCEKKVVEALSAIDGLTIHKASFALEKACVTGDGVTQDALQAALGAAGYEITEAKAVSACPPELTKGAKKAAWSDIDGLDVKIVSTGGKVKLASVLAEGKFTVIDFGAPWCGPCHKVEAELKTYLKAHDDTAVRAVILDAADPMASFALPAAKQHLKWASGLPYFVVFGTDGGKLYTGQSLEEALAAIAAARGDG